MPRFTAQIWLPNEHPYEVETSAANIFAAKEIIARREGVDEKYVNRVFTIHEDDSSSSSSRNYSNSDIDNSNAGDTGGVVALCAILFFIWLIAEYWYIVIPVGIILAILFYFVSKDD